MCVNKNAHAQLLLAHAHKTSIFGREVIMKSTHVSLMRGRRQSPDFPSLHEMLSIDHRRRASRKRTFGGPSSGNGISLTLDRLEQFSSEKIGKKCCNNVPHNIMMKNTLKMHLFEVPTLKKIK